MRPVEVDQPVETLFFSHKGLCGFQTKEAGFSVKQIQQPTHMTLKDRTEDCDWMWEDKKLKHKD